MKWEGVFFVKKVEIDGVFVKKWKMAFFVKKVDLSSTQGALCTVSVFLFYFILYLTYLGGGAYTPNAPLPVYGPGQSTVAYLTLSFQEMAVCSSSETVILTFTHFTC